MESISKTELISILEASKYFSPEAIEKIKRLTGATPAPQILEKLVECHILSSETGQKFQDFVAGLEKDASRKSLEDSSTIQQFSIYQLPLDKKKEIFFARHVITQGFCTVEDVNKCFVEQGNMERKIKKSFPLGQMMVKNNLIPAKRFGEICRDIEEKMKNGKLDMLIADDKNLQAVLKNDVINFVQGSIPEKFGPYKILAEIARGGMGVVYKAWDNKLRRPLALKVLKAWENPTLEEIQRFHREARLAASLKHPNIVSIYDAGVVEGVHYFTMDYVEGETLSQYLTRERPTPTQSLLIIHAMADALAYAHTQKIIHRDVKPGNIMLDASKRPLLTDFGLAKGVSAGDSRDLTKSGSTIGTPAYMSPEQARGETEIDGRSDIYSLGAVLYEMLTGKPPFEGHAVGALISAVLSQEPIAPSKLNRDLDPAIEAVCLKAIHKDARQRYQTASDMAEDIQRCLACQTTKAKPTTFWQRLLRKLSVQAHGLFYIMVIMALCAPFVCWIGWAMVQEYLQAQQLYQTGEKLILEQNYQTALAPLRDAARHSMFASRVDALLHKTADQFLTKANSLGDNYQEAEKEIQKFYRQALQRLQDAKEWQGKIELWSELEKLQELKQKNAENLEAAHQHLAQVILLEPYRQDGYMGMGKIYQLKLGEAYQKDNGEQSWHLHNYKFYTHQAAEVAPSLSPCTGKIHITSQPDKAKIYLFGFQSHFLRLLPVSWKRLENHSSTDKQLVADSTEPVLEQESYLGETPVRSPVLPPGNYLIIAEANDCMQTRRLVTVENNKETPIHVAMSASLPVLAGYIPLANLAVGQEWAYFLSKYETSCKEYSKFVNDYEVITRYKSTQNRGENRYLPHGSDGQVWQFYQNQFVFNCDENMPVVGISWHDATEYCQWLTRQLRGRVIFRLPFLKEWEHAAGKEDGRRFTWGNQFDLNFLLGPRIKDGKKVHASGLAVFDASPYGIYDMAGNAREWCLDNSEINSQVSIISGGSVIMEHPACFQIGYHGVYPKNFTASDLGFRVLALIPKN